MVVDFVTPFRDRTLELLDDQAHLTQVLEQGRQQAAGGRAGHPRRRLPARGVRREARSSRLSRFGPVPTIGVARRHPGALGDRAPGLPHQRRRRDGRDHPDPHHAGPADRGRPTTSSRRSRRTSTAAADEVPAFEVHLRGTGTFRPVSPGGLRDPGRGHLAVRAARRPPYAADRSPSTWPSPTTRTSPSPTTSPRPSSTRPSTSWPTSSASSTSTDFHLYVHDEELGWTPTRYFALAPGYLTAMAALSSIA